MSEVWGQQDTAAFAGQAAANEALTAGALLRRAREDAGIHVAALAVSLKVPVRKLEALEEDRWEVLPDAVFARALASSICRTLKIDPQPVLDRLPQTTAPRLIHSGEGINTPFRAPSDSAAPSWLDQLSRPVYLAVFALLLGALVLILLPTVQTEDRVAATSSAPAPAAASPAAARPSPAVDPAVMTVAAQGAQPVGPAVAPPGFMPTAAASAAAAAAPPSSARPAAGTEVKATPATAAASESATAAAAPASDIIVFRTKRDSWVEVIDAKGVVAVRRVLAAGEAAGASGALPLQVVIGRVDATEVQVRGKPFDLRRVSRDNVARFQVK
jgi:cytoskeleton protein RodZ